MVLPTAWVRWKVADLEADGHRRVVAINRNGRARIVGADVVLQEGDQVHLAVDEAGLDELRPMIMTARSRQEEARERASAQATDQEAAQAGHVAGGHP